MLPVLLSLFFLSLVEVYSLTVTPHLSFLEINLTNHSYVNFSEVSWYERVVCHSYLQRCCSWTQGRYLRGDWVFPNGTSLTRNYLNGVYQTWEAQRVELIRASWIETPPNGLYRCEIAVSSDNPSLKQSLYIGLYTNDTGKTVTLMEHMLITKILESR